MVNPIIKWFIIPRKFYEMDYTSYSNHYVSYFIIFFLLYINSILHYEAEKNIGLRARKKKFPHIIGRSKTNNLIAIFRFFFFHSGI